MSTRSPLDTRRTPSFRPAAVLSLFYFAGFFMLFGMLLVFPELMRVLESTPPGPEQQKAAEELVHAVFRPRLPFAVALAIAATAAGIWFKALPGLRF